ncbi:MAG: TRAP transporter substrate-binding protein [Alphaproteobacteria bacterium]|nr:TRAP transporter substrate-binding protein [Alphaproteobacteria bacterium]MCY4496912.1 TRAP transporter substrate-binding protein [Rhodospirillaceae bacterium]
MTTTFRKPIHHRWRLIACLSSLAFLFVSFGLAPGPGLAAEVELKFSHVNPPTHSSHMMALHFAEKAKELSGGRISIEVVPSGQLGGLKASIDSAKLGTPIIAYAPASIAQDYANTASIMDAAYMFDTVEHAERFIEGAGGKMIWDDIEKGGLKRLFSSFFGTRQLWLRECGKAPADFGKLKMRVPPARIQSFNSRANGLSPTPIDFPETYGALQAGVVDGVDVTPSSFVASKFAETGLKCVMLTSHNFLMQPAFMNKELFDGMAPELQKALLEAGRAAAAYNKGLTNDEEGQILKTITADLGVEVVGPEDGLDLAAFRKNAAEIIYTEFEKDWGQELLDEVEKTR